MSKLHLIMPMGGRGQRFFDDGFVIPKPLIEIKGKPFFYWSVMSVKKFIADCDITFVVLQEHVDEFDIVNKIKQYFEEARIVIIPQVLKGAVLTCMEGAKVIDDLTPIVCNDCDHMFKSTELNRFVNANTTNVDGALITFKSQSPKFSYVKCDERGIVERTVEKEVISEQAICGAYYFKNKNIFMNYAQEYLKNCSYSEYFMSGVYNEMAAQGMKSVVFETDFHVSFGTPEEYRDAEEREEFEEFV